MGFVFLFCFFFILSSLIECRIVHYRLWCATKHQWSLLLLLLLFFQHNQPTNAISITLLRACMLSVLTVTSHSFFFFSHPPSLPYYPPPACLPIDLHQLADPYAYMTPRLKSLVLWEKPAVSGGVLASSLALVLSCRWVSLLNVACAAFVFGISASFVYVNGLLVFNRVTNKSTARPLE